MKEINDSEFDDFVKSNETVIIDFWADWCGPCKMVAPIFDELSKEFEGKAVFAKMDITENPNTPSKFGVVSIPTLTTLFVFSACFFMWRTVSAKFSIICVTPIISV